MAVYADYSFYIEDYGGTAVPETEFSALLIRAQAQLDIITRYRITTVTRDVALAVCAAADALYLFDKTGGQTVSSESVGVWSRTYVQGGRRKTTQSVVYDAVRPYLLETELLYGGIDV